MTRIGLIAALAMVASASVYAQGQQFEPVVPRAPESRTESAPVPALVMDPRRGQSDADARHCLEFATDREVHRCAEKYRSRTARVSSAAKAPKAPGSEVATSADPAQSRK